MKVAIWGAGRMGEVHGSVYQNMGDDVQVAYMIERDEKKAAEFSEKFQCIAVDSISALREKEVTVIDICLPTCLHSEAIREAILICDYIFCEKPVCLTREEYNDLRRMAEDSGCHLMIGQVLRFWNGYIKARELALKGEIGTPRLITCLRRQKIPAWSKGNWLMDNQQSGGILMDLCIHDIDYLCWLMGRPEAVSCKIVKKEGTTLHGILNISYAGCQANVIGSWGMPEGFNHGELQTLLEIVGDTGMITYKGGDVLEIIRGAEKECVCLPHEDGYERELAYFVDCVRHHAEPVQSNLLSVEGTMEVLWAAGESAESEQGVRFNGGQPGH